MKNKPFVILSLLSLIGIAIVVLIRVMKESAVEPAAGPQPHPPGSDETEPVIKTQI